MKEAPKHNRFVVLGSRTKRARKKKPAKLSNEKRLRKRLATETENGNTWIVCDEDEPES